MHHIEQQNSECCRRNRFDDLCCPVEPGGAGEAGEGHAGIDQVGELIRYLGRIEKHRECVGRELGRDDTDCHAAQRHKNFLARPGGAWRNQGSRCDLGACLPPSRLHPLLSFNAVAEVESLVDGQIPSFPGSGGL